MKYIQFAKEEPELFKLLFITGDAKEHFTHFLPAYDENAPLILETIENSYDINTEKAKKLYSHMSVYAYGFAALYAQKMNIFTMDDISRMMTEMFTALMK